MANSPFIYGPNGATSLVPGGVNLPGSTSGTLQLEPAASTTSYTLTFPAAQGGASTFLQNNGSGVLSWVSGTTPSYTAPTVQTFFATGYYTFTVSSANATVGATYTNNGQTFTVVYTISAGTTLVCSSTGAPTSSGTLTKATGTGDATITFSAEVSHGTYFPTSGSILYIRVRAVAAGGGGAGGGTGAVSGTTAGNTNFGTSLTNQIVCTGGAGGSGITGAGGAGGGASLGSGPIGIAIAGGSGDAEGATVGGASSGAGGTSALGGSGGSALGIANNPGVAAASNTGSGGSGGASGTGGGGAGGGAGGYVDAVIYSPAASYQFIVPAGGTGGSAGSSGGAGGSGGSGMIIVEEFYQ